VVSNFLQRPYPFIESTPIRLSLSFVIGLVVFLLLNTYRPFGIEQIPSDQTAFVAGFGLIAMLALMVSLFTFPFFIKIENWTVKSEIQFHLFNWLLTSIWAYAYNTTIGFNISPQHSLFDFIFIVAAIYFVPLMVMIFITEKYFQQRNQQEALLLNHHLESTNKEKSNESDILTITPETSSSSPLKINLADFIYAASDNNYVMLHFLNSENVLDKQLLRLSLKKLETQVCLYNDLCRCHKSYIVNRQSIEEVEGNARSLYIKTKHSDFKIPVSRSFDRSLLG